MNLIPSNRKLAFGLLAVVVLLAPASALPAGGGLFIGAGSGQTPDTAIRAATEDAQACAESVGLFTCMPVGEPEIFFGTGPKGLTRYRAQVSLECTQ